MIQLKDIRLFYGSQAIFDDISLSISPHVRMGLVGRNGSGKSTLLEAIVNPTDLDDGTITTGNIKIAYLPQDLVLASEKSILNEALSDFEHLEPEELPLQTVEVKKVLTGLGFKQEQFDQPVANLSTGWKMRLILAKLLLKDADFYLFDEPTNHLDIFAQQWFLEFLNRATFGFLLVCHERAFLNNACSEILELERGKGTIYHGNYEAYRIKKSENLERLRSAHALQQKEMTRLKETADRFRASASKATFAQSLLKKLDKMEVIELPEEDTRVASIPFPPPIRAAKQILTVNNVSKTFNGKMLFKNVNFTIEREMKVALVAANGVGKTTLFRIISGEYPCETGTITFGDNVHNALFKQNQHESLSPKNTVLEEIFTMPSKKSEGELRRMLGAFLFSGESVYKKTSVLSGGEKNRLCMVKTLLVPSNFLMLDEPTNHLDIPSKDVLLRALKSYPGTLLFVSHDQDFVNNLATHILELTPEGVTLYKGNFDEFIEQRAYRASREPNGTSGQDFGTPDGSTNGKPQRFELQKRAQRLEEKIAKLEQQQELLCIELGEHDYGSPPYTATFTKLTATQQDLEAASREWEQLTQQLS